MSELHAQTLFQSNLVTVTQERCSGHDTRRGHEESAPAHELVFVRAGAFVRRNPAGTVLADRCVALLFNRDQPFQISHPTRGGDVCLSFRIRPDALIDALRASDPSADDRHDSPFQRGSIRLAAGCHLALHEIVSLTQRGGDALAVEERALALASAVLRAESSHRPPTPSRRELSARREIVSQTLMTLNTRSREKLSLDELAALAFTSPFHLCRVFKAETGQPIHQRLETLRLLDALDQIASQPATLADIALTAGFANHSHFTASFRRVFGLTPSQFRDHLTSKLVERRRAN